LPTLTLSPSSSQRSGREGLRRRKAEAAALLRQLVDPEALFALRAFDRQAQLLRQGAGAAGVVDVAVGQQQLFDADTPRLAAAACRRSVSPPGSTRAPCMVSVHQIRLQFCSKGVTGMMR
jgi:hypothetical protein